MAVIEVPWASQGFRPGFYRINNGLVMPRAREADECKWPSDFVISASRAAFPPPLTRPRSTGWRTRIPTPTTWRASPRPNSTTLCPITGQPDFAHLVIDYVPAQWLVESKSFKLYLGSFRNIGGFHEDCTVTIGKKLVALLKPKWVRIGGYWYPRGGMPIDVFWQAGRLPAGVWVPDQGVAPYRGRG